MHSAKRCMGEGVMVQGVMSTGGYHHHHHYRISLIVSFSYLNVSFCPICSFCSSSFRLRSSLTSHHSSIHTIRRVARNYKAHSVHSHHHTVPRRGTCHMVTYLPSPAARTPATTNCFANHLHTCVTANWQRPYYTQQWYVWRERHNHSNWLLLLLLLERHDHGTWLLHYTCICIYSRKGTLRVQQRESEMIRT